MRLSPLRSVFAAGAVAFGALAVSSATASAAGESTTATLTSPAVGESADSFTWSYAFNQNEAHGLSNIAVAFCDPDILADVEESEDYDIFLDGDVPGGHTGFGPGIKLNLGEDPPAAGEFTILFGSEHEAVAGGLRIQSHSGDGQVGDDATSAAGPGPCSTDEPDPDPDPDPDPQVEPEVEPKIEPKVEPTVEPVTETAPLVLGQTLTAPVAVAQLPRTGSDSAQTLTYAGLSLLFAGLACGRRRRTVSTA